MTGINMSSDSTFLFLSAASFPQCIYPGKKWSMVSLIEKLTSCVYFLAAMPVKMRVTEHGNLTQGDSSEQIISL